MRVVSTYKDQGIIVRKLTLQYPDLTSVKKEIETEIAAYTNAIVTLASFREYLRNLGINSYIEKKIEKKGGGFKTPDL